jgi:hypothetical protein
LVATRESSLPTIGRPRAKPVYPHEVGTTRVGRFLVFIEFLIRELEEVGPVRRRGVAILMLTEGNIP